MAICSSSSTISIKSQHKLHITIQFIVSLPCPFLCFFPWHARTFVRSLFCQRGIDFSTCCWLWRIVGGLNSTPLDSFDKFMDIFDGLQHENHSAWWQFSIQLTGTKRTKFPIANRNLNPKFDQAATSARFIYVYIWFISFVCISCAFMCSCSTSMASIQNCFDFRFYVNRQLFYLPFELFSVRQVTSISENGFQ